MADKDSPPHEPKKNEPSVDVKNPHDLIQRMDVEIVLKKDKGPDASVIAFKVEDFTAKGDNYMCIVSSVNVKYWLKGAVMETSYVVKLNPCRSSNFEHFATVVFEKEIGFYSQILPILNAELERINEDALRLPKYIHSIRTVSREVIYLEDLRRSGFKMFDRKKGLDKEHAELVLKELGRLHAASVLFMNTGKFAGVDIVERFPIFKEAYAAMDDDGSGKTWGKIMNNLLDNAANIAEKTGGYDKVVNFLRSKKDEGKTMFQYQLKTSNHFKVICHGDCWNNNFLFRYSADGRVEDCRLLDLQIIRIGSPALDLNYMMYCSLTGDVRRSNMDSFFCHYFASFSSVLAGSGVAARFTLPQLKDEFYRKNTFGLLMGLMLIPLVLTDTDDAPDIEDYMGEGMEVAMKEYQEEMAEVLQKNPLLRPRLLELFDEMLESEAIY